MKYRVSGKFYPAGKEMDFEKEIEAENEDVARERIYTVFGSKHRLKRTQVKINEVEKA